MLTVMKSACIGIMNSETYYLFLKVPGCNFACLQFVPQYEAPQLHLSHEWRLAQLAMYNLQHLDQERPLLYLSNVHDAASRIESHSTAVQGTTD